MVSASSIFPSYPPPSWCAVAERAPLPAAQGLDETVRKYLKKDEHVRLPLSPATPATPAALWPNTLQRCIRDGGGREARLCRWGDEDKH